MTGIGRDLHYAARVFRRTPLFSFAATGVLAVALAVAAAAFSLYNHLALRPVPGVQDSARLVSIGLLRDAEEWIPFSLLQFRDLSEILTVPEVIVGTIAGGPAEVEIDGLATEATVIGVIPGYFRDLGVRIGFGADLASANPDPAARNAVISDRFWRDRFDASPGAIGRVVNYQGEDFTIVGIAAPGFAGLGADRREDIWIPLESRIAVMGGPRAPEGAPEAQRRMLEEHARTMRLGMPMIRVVARLPAGTGPERLQQELDSQLSRIRENWTSVFPSPDLMRMEVLPGTSTDPRTQRVLVTQSQLFAGGAILILVVASLNLAAYFLGRGPGRIQELRTRLAIGASRGAIIRQLSLESLALVGIGAAIGAVLHIWLRAMLLRLPPFVDAPAAGLQVGTDWRVVAFLALASVFMAIVAGLVPAARVATRQSLAVNAPTTLGRGGRNLQGLLVIQVSVATLVVLAGTLFAIELRRLENVPTGFDIDRTIAAPVTFDRAAMVGGGISISMQPGQVESFQAELGARLDTVPGVEASAFATLVPFVTAPNNVGLVELLGVPEQPPEDRRRVYENATDPRIFETLGIPIVIGRAMSADDANEIVVSQALARRLWGREDVLGERISPDMTGGIRVSGGGVTITRRSTSGPGEDPPPRDVLTVVGIAGDIRYAGKEEVAPPVYYRSGTIGLMTTSLVVRGEVDREVLHPIVDELIRERMYPHIFSRFRLLSDEMAASLRDERSRSRLALGAAVIAMLLTMIGLYASMLHMVDARRGEFALRKAVGAGDGDLITMILRRTAGILAAGCSGALAVALLAGERTNELLFGLDALSPVAWVVAVGVVLATGLAAAWLPALRAGRVDPAVALRYE